MIKSLTVMGQSCPAQTLVAQVSNLPYRGFPIRRRRETPVSHGSPAVSRLEVGDTTADWKSALQPGETAITFSPGFCVDNGARPAVDNSVPKSRLWTGESKT